MDIIGKCPVCGNDLNVAKLKCNHCHIEIAGDFTLSKFDYLEKSEVRFIELFLVNQGNIKEMEKQLGISYPTVKKLLDQIVNKLGLTLKESAPLSQKEIYEKVAKGELSPEEAAKLLV